jgi:hypothetical protein
VQSCARCSRSFDPSCLIEWQFRGRRVPMHPRYVEELRSLVAGPWGRLRLPVPIVETAIADAPPSLFQVRHPRPDVGAARASHAAGLPTPDQLPVGATVRLAVQGKYADVVGVIEKRGRTRFHVRTQAGLLTVPFAAVVPVH